MGVRPEVRRKTDSYITPSGLIRHVVDNHQVYFPDAPREELYTFNANRLLTGVLQPHFKNFETPIATVDGMFVPQMTKKGDFTLVDFSQHTHAGFNSDTLLATSAALQGARKSMTKKSDSWEIPIGNRPVAFETEFAENLRKWIHNAGVISAKTEFQVDNKALFYSVLSEMMGIVLGKGDKPQEAFNYFMSSEKNSKGFGLYAAFFPRLAAVINEEAIYHLLSEDVKYRYGFEEILRGFVQLFPKQEVDTQLAIEFAFILQFSNETKKNLIELSKTHKTLNIDLSLSKERVGEQITRLLNGLPPSPVQEEKIVESLPSPEYYGMNINIPETELMRNYFGKKEALVVSPEQIRKNPTKFYEYQRDLVLTIARNMNICIDPTSNEYPVPVPHGYDDPEDKLKLKIKSFRRIESILKDTSDWAWLLLYPQVQEEFLKHLPYTRVPPYVLIGHSAVPLYDVEKREQVMETIDLEPNRLINELPFLNNIAIKVGKNGWKFEPSHSLTIIGNFISEVLKNGGIPYIDHGIARWILGDWGETFNLDPSSYSLYSWSDANISPKVDVDMLILGIKNLVAPIASKIVKRINSNFGASRRTIISGLMLGRSMGKIIYTYLTKQTDENKPHHRFIQQNSYLAAHDKACFMQGLEARQAGENPSDTRLLIESIIGFSRLRSFGLIPEELHDVKGRIGYAVKAVDPLGGLIDYIEAGGGITIAGLKRNIVRFADLPTAFPKDQIFSVWHMLRTVSELIYTKNGAIILPEGVSSESYRGVNAIIAMKTGTEQLKPYLIEVTSFLNRIRTSNINVDPIVKQDLRQELNKTARGLIEADLVKFLILCSDEKVVDEKLAIMGIEMSRFFPHLDIIRRERPIFWKKMIEKVRTTELAPFEKPLHFLARIMIETDPDILKKVATEIEIEFNYNHERTWSKLQESHGEEAQKALYEHGYVQHGGWKYLDPDGVGKFAFEDRLWGYVLQFIKKNGGLSAADLKDIHLIQHHYLRTRSANSASAFSMALQDAIQFEGRLASECQIDAFSDWLIDSGI